MYWLFMYASKYIFLQMSAIKLQSEILLPAVSYVLDTADFATSFILKLVLEISPRTEPYRIHHGSPLLLLY